MVLITQSTGRQIENFMQQRADGHRVSEIKIEMIEEEKISNLSREFQAEKLKKIPQIVIVDKPDDVN